MAAGAARVAAMPSASPRSRAGFSLIEATVMLAVAGMALMLVFAVATKASDQGFRLGRLALGAADAEAADDTFRTLIAGLSLQPSPPLADGGSFEGTAEAFEGPAVLGRGGPCAPAGPAAAIRVELRHAPSGDRLLCRSATRQAVLMELNGRAALSYSEDGRTWVGRYTDRPGFGGSSEATAPGVVRRSRRLYVRLATLDGRLDIVAAGARDRPGQVETPPVRPDAPL
jgi:hypothetical protein